MHTARLAVAAALMATACTGAGAGSCDEAQELVEQGQASEDELLAEYQDTPGHQHNMDERQELWNTALSQAERWTIVIEQNADCFTVEERAAAEQRARLVERIRESQESS